MTYVYIDNPKATEAQKKKTRTYEKYANHLYRLYTETHRQRKDAPQLWEKYQKIYKEYNRLFNLYLGYTLNN